MYRLFKRRIESSDLLASELYDQDTFYEAFLHDLKDCTSELIIESPFITARRMSALLPILKKLRSRGVRIIVNTRDPQEHDGTYQMQAEQVVADLQALNVVVLFTAGHHRKLAILDKATVWEGSLNILSHNDSCEIMRRIMSVTLAHQMICFLKLDKYLLK